ncbi:MAG: cell division protein FtsA [Alphaproteobacteria bacterium]
MPLFKDVRNQSEQVIAAIDIGSSKICCLIATVDSENGFKIIGLGHQVSKGVRSGTIVDMDAAEEAILNAVYTAEQMAGRTIDRVVVNLSGGNPSSTIIEHKVLLPKEEVSLSDIRRLVHQENYKPQNDADQIIHLVPVSYNIDDSTGITDPKGMFGKTLGVNMNVVTAGMGSVKNLVNCITRCHLDISSIIVSPYASGLSCLIPDEKKIGVTVIDMGGGTTSFAVFLDGKIVYADTIPVGGGHVTNDIAKGLSTTITEAERLKILHGCASFGTVNEHEIIHVPQIGEENTGKKNHLPKSLLANIIKPRVEEIFEIIKDRLEKKGFYELSGRRVVLTGGASQLAGTSEIASLVLEKKVRIGYPMMSVRRIENPSDEGIFSNIQKNTAFVTCTGLLAYAAQGGHTQSGSSSGAAPKTLAGQIKTWLKDNF